MTMKPGQAELANLRRLLALAREEDLGGGDVTCTLLPEKARARGRFVAREGLLVCGTTMLETMARAYDERIDTTVCVGDAQPAAPGDVLAEWSGPAGGILSAERVALNFLQRLCGIATLTRKYADAVAGTGAEIYDTRKTTPGWRRLEKYAVRCGGGKNHRMGLYDAVLLKDNHLAVLARGGQDEPIAAIAPALDEVRTHLGRGGFIEVEVDTLQQLAAALTLAVDFVLLDNMSVDQLRAAAALRDRADLPGRVALEASGGITLENVRRIASTGVERISVGALTHSARAADVALDVEFCGEQS